MKITNRWVKANSCKTQGKLSSWTTPSFLVHTESHTEVLPSACSTSTLSSLGCPGPKHLRVKFCLLRFSSAHAKLSWESREGPPAAKMLILAFLSGLSTLFSAQSSPPELPSPQRFTFSQCSLQISSSCFTLKGMTMWPWSSPCLTRELCLGFTPTAHLFVCFGRNSLSELWTKIESYTRHQYFPCDTYTHFPDTRASQHHWVSFSRKHEASCHSTEYALPYIIALVMSIFLPSRKHHMALYLHITTAVLWGIAVSVPNFTVNKTKAQRG
jgi:hypothetical protein